MMQELYIDGVLVDIDERLSVSLNIKSNLLGDVSKIAANHTYIKPQNCTWIISESKIKK